jgi:hypothetical protein
VTTARGASRFDHIDFSKKLEVARLLGNTVPMELTQHSRAPRFTQTTRGCIFLIGRGRARSASCKL